ncbi:hydroxymethylcytosylglucuronate/cytosylglucuronate synthase [Kitasatospora sp. HPMI-4]|uniref:hydroxymethylcytosylglucuronate/cytosylglucurona te synthase n=1 Tax=Kitasatospora sp. HPMI-4 TaxID=3448443 RepID=UPI003F1A9FB9
MHTDSAAQTVAIAGAEFGWGSAGKLSAVLSALRQRSGPPLRFIGLASGLGRPLLSGHPVDRWYDLPADGPPDALAKIVHSERVRAALVVLDGSTARALGALGVPTVFVDSLPFMWSEGDRPALPLDAAVYCAQKCVELPPECFDVLAAVRALHWVDAVIGTPQAAVGRRPARPYRSALVSVGGLRAPRLADWTDYPTVVLPAVLEALAAHGVQEVHLAGNLPAGLAGRLVDSSVAPPRTTSGALTHGEFLDRLSDCDVLLTSPGLTTLLEAGSLGVPTVCLPPQNLSQIFNGRFHSQAVGAEVRVVWPKDVLAEEEALSLRSQGEERALELIYAAIGAAAADGRGTARALGEGIRTALRRSTAGGIDWGALTTAVGTGGAAQVADALLVTLRGAAPPS